MRKILLTSAALLLAVSACTDSVQTSPENTPAPITTSQPADFFDGAWSEDQTALLLDKTMPIKFAYGDSGLTENERAAVKELLAAGERFHTLYLTQIHPQGREIETAINGLSGRQDLKDLFRIMKGPVATTLDNNRESFLSVAPLTSAKNVYPDGTSREVMDAYLEANPERTNELLDLRAVVKAANDENKQAAFKILDQHPTLEVLHPGIRQTITDADTYFALPYSMAYAEDIFFVYDRLNAAAGLIEGEDIAFARFLRLRARDLLADNYDGSDAMWVTGDYTGSLNAQIGSYETYDDALYGVKSFFSLSLLKRDKAKSKELAGSIGDLQSIENALPYKAQKTVSSNIPVAVYNVIADFGQARGTNTATILPNEGHLSRQFGRTILIRSNVLRNEAIFETSRSSFMAATDPAHHGDLDLEGNFYRTLWHEIGHYLGPDQTKSGGDIDVALQNSADLFEEMKADLVSLFSAPKLHARGAYSDAQLRSIYASGVLRTLQKNKPRRSQAYGTMKLIQFNWYLDKGLLSIEDGRVVIDYDKYPDAVDTLLKEVLNIQHQGQRGAANAFVDKWTNWDADLHGVIGQNMKATEKYRFRHVTYEALGE